MLKAHAFTLSELLISLSILRLIIVFGIPQILTSYQNQQSRAIAKDVVSAFLGAIYEVTLNNDLASFQSGGWTQGLNQIISVFSSKINAVRVCPTDSVAKSCWNPVIQGYSAFNSAAYPGLVSHSGANLLFSYNYGQLDHIVIYIDFNGANGPNQEGTDQLLLWGCLSTSCGAAIGSLIPASSAFSILYSSIFKGN